jgi:hypothetical protein
MAEEKGQDMATLVGFKESQRGWEPPPAKALDEGVWQAWVATGRARDRRVNDALVRTAKWVSIAGLLVAAGLWSHLAPYQVVVRFVVAAGATAVMLQAFHARHYAFAAVCGALVLLYNPLAPMVEFSGDWQRAVTAASAVPFVASLTWRNGRLAHND